MGLLSVLLTGPPAARWELRGNQQRSEGMAVGPASRMPSLGPKRSRWGEMGSGGPSFSAGVGKAAFLPCGPDGGPGERSE